MRTSWLVLAPLVPTPDDARDDLRRELLRPEYRDRDVVERVLTWVQRRVSTLLDATERVPPVSAFLALVVLAALLVGLGLLVSRARRTARASTGAGPVRGAEVVPAAELRRRAEAALERGDHRTAVVDGFRALTVRQVEAGVLADEPGATAHEVAAVLTREHADRLRDPARGPQWCAALFDEVLYGERPATAAGARAVLDLDDALTGRPVSIR